MNDINTFPLGNTLGIILNEDGNFDVDFDKRNRWFTDEEEEILKRNGFISQMGMFNKDYKLIINEDGTRTMSDEYNEKPYNYSRACAGQNTLYPSLEAYCMDSFASLIEEHGLEEVVAYIKEKLGDKL